MNHYNNSFGGINRTGYKWWSVCYRYWSI